MAAEPQDETLAREIAEAKDDPERQLGRYLLLEEIGRGGMGAVFRAWDPRLERQVAIKVVHSARGRVDPVGLERFEREAKAAARLNHPSIVQVYDVGRNDSGDPFIVMDLVVGRSLLARIKAGMSREDALAHVAQIARALDHAHRQGIVHRDVKPANIFIDEDRDRPLMMDFGCAADTLDDARLTGEGMTIGTPNYMPPEQARGLEVGPGADVYGVGGVLYRLVCGAPPFKGDGPMDTMLKIVQDPPAPPSERADDVPPALEAIILRCLQKEPPARYPSAGELADDIERFLLEGTSAAAEAQGGPPAAAGGPAPVAPRPGSARAARAGSSRVGRPGSSGRARPGSSGRARAASGSGESAAATVGGRGKLIAAGGLLVGLLVGLAVVVAMLVTGEDGSPPAPGPTPTGADPGPRVALGPARLESPAPGLITGGDAITVSGWVPAGSAESVWIGSLMVPVDGEGRFGDSVPLGPAEGAFPIVVSSEADGAGRSLAAVTITIDRSPPVLDVELPAEDAAVSAVPEVALRGAVAELHPDMVSASVDGGPEVVLLAGEQGRFETTLLAEGDRDRSQVTVIARDRAGNETRIARTVRFDLDPPRIVVTQTPADGVTREASATLRGHIVDAHPAALTADGEAVALAPDGTFEVEVRAGPEDGERSVVLVATDAAGHSSPPHTERILFDTTPPELFVEDDAPDVTRAAQLTVRGAATDATGLPTVTIGGIAIAVEADGRFAAPVPLDEGDNVLEVVATDAAGNRATAEVSVRRDATAPAITLDPPLPEAQYGRERYAEINGRVDDPLATIEVNGDAVDLEDGAFEDRVRLSEGENQIVITATDPLGNQARLELAVRYARRRPAKNEAVWQIDVWRKDGNGALPDFDALGKPDQQVELETLNFPNRRAFERRLPGADPADRFALRARGWFRAPRTGDYTFRLHSDDGSRLLIRDKQAIDNDGVHAPRSRRRKVKLEAGEEYAMTVEFAQGGGGATLELHVTGPDGKELLVRCVAPPRGRRR